MNRVLKSRLRSRVIVTLKSGATFDGILVEADKQAWVLRETTAVTPNARPVPVDGEMFFMAADVDYVQRP